MDEEIQNPHARRALSEAHEQLDRMSRLPEGLHQQRDNIEQALGNPELAAAFNDFLNNFGGAVQEHVHTTRAQLAGIADMQRREEQAERDQRGTAENDPAQGGSVPGGPAQDGVDQSSGEANGERPLETGET